MKFTSDVIPSLFIPLLGLGENNTAPLALPASHLNDSLNVPLNMFSAGATPTGGAQALFSHMPHDRHSHSDWNENTHRSICEGEDGVKRPRAGQASTRVHTKRILDEATTCPTPPVLSCSARTMDTHSCCVVKPGGVLVHTQLWDLDLGEANSWGIHGLWPDMCSGKYYERCDDSRAYSGEKIKQALQHAGQSNMIDYMNVYWVSNDESVEDFWAHEWKTHGTCVSTLEPQCFTGYTTAQEVVPYFETVVQLFRNLDTYTALTSAGITPSSSNTYTLAQLQDAVSSSLGYVPDFTCTSGQLSSVQYYLNAQGPLQDGAFVASHATRKSNCPKTGIQWPPKTVGNDDDGGNDNE